MESDVLMVVVIVTALAFDFTNGFHDTANAMATSIATGALKPRVAVALSAVLNFAGAFISVAVATTIARDILSTDLITLDVLFAGLLGAIIWNLATWAIGVPSSSSHALIGGLVGAALVYKGADAIEWDGLVEKVIIPAAIAPAIACGLALSATYITFKLRERAEERGADATYKLGQIGSASLVSLAHGTNDAQKTMGVIMLALIINGQADPNAFTVPIWVKASAASAIALGTYTGGWRIIRTLGHRLAGDIDPPQGFSAESSTASVLLASSYFGYPLSTTQISSGSVLGSGIGKRLAQVHWGTARQIAVAWMLTLPSAAVVAALAFGVSEAIGGAIGAVIVGAMGAALAISLAITVHRRDPITADNVNAA